MNNFLVDAGIIKGEKVVVWRPKKKEEDKNKPSAPAAAAPAAKPKEETKK